MKISLYWVIAFVILAVVGTYVFINYIYVPGKTVSFTKRKNYDVITLTLPNSVDQSVFGPKYWEAYNFLDNNIPCAICRNKAVPLGTFRHDVVNALIGKPIHDRDNWNKWVGIVNDLNSKNPA